MKTFKSINILAFAVVSLFLSVVTNASAQDQYMENSLKKYAELYKAELERYKFENIEENSLPIEKWMSSANYWGEIENESLSIENWMKDTNFWVESESTLRLENWMFDTELWNCQSEASLKLSSWMYDTSYWAFDGENKLNIENWMFNTNFWNL